MPPDTATDAAPVQSPKHVTTVCEGVTIKAGGWVTLKLVVVVQALVSVTVAEITLGQRLINEAVPAAGTVNVPPGLKLTV